MPFPTLSSFNIKPINTSLLPAIQDGWRIAMLVHYPDSGTPNGLNDAWTITTSLTRSITFWVELSEHPHGIPTSSMPTFRPNSQSIAHFGWAKTMASSLMNVPRLLKTTPIAISMIVSLLLLDSPPVSSLLPSIQPKSSIFLLKRLLLLQFLNLSTLVDTL